MNLGATVYRIHGTNAPETIGQAVRQVASGWSTTMSPIFTRACSSAPRSWCSINSAAEDMLFSVMEFSERPLRGGLSVFIRADIWLNVRYGTKQTSACALHMSAFDPKRTLGGAVTVCC